MFLTFNESFNKFARTLICIFVALFPIISYKGFIYDAVSTRALNLIFLVEILVIAIAFILFNKNAKLKVLKSPISLGLVLLFISLLISSFFGVDFISSFWSKITRATGLFYFLHLGMFYFFIVMFFKEKTHIRDLISVFVVSTAVFSIGSVLSIDGFNLIYQNRNFNGGFLFGNSTFSAMYMYVGFILSLYYAYSTPKNKRKFWHYVLPVIILLGPVFFNYDVILGGADILNHPSNIMGSAMASTIALVFSTILLALIWGISKLKSVKTRRFITYGMSILGLLIATFAIYSLLTPAGFIQNQYAKMSSNARPIVWQLSEEAIKERPTFGYGVDNFGYAFEDHYDNRLLEQANGSEPWFDRAHNVFIDQAVETGRLGVAIYILAYLLIVGSMLYVLLRSKKRDEQVLAIFILVYFVGHLMELQTAFDTVISYMPLAMMAGFATLLFHQTYTENVGEKSEWTVPEPLKYLLGLGFIVIFGGLFFVGTLPILRSNIANGEVRTIGSSEKRPPLYEILFNTPMDKAGILTRTFSDFKGGISQKPEVLAKEKWVENFKKESNLFAKGYQEHLEKHPNDYRARLNLTNLYIYDQLFGQQHLEEARSQALKAIELVPQAPQAYWHIAVSYLYQRNFDQARLWAQKAYDLNPNIEESKAIKDYIEDSIKTFPEVEFYNFGML